jgi:hypothetical protein
MQTKRCERVGVDGNFIQKLQGQKHKVKKVRVKSLLKHEVGAETPKPQRHIFGILNVDEIKN